MPVKAAGWRIEPPVSVPVTPGASPAATAAADPPDEPPGVRAALPPSLARHADLVHARQALRLLQLADMPVDLGLVGVERQEARDIERDDEVPGIGLA